MIVIYSETIFNFFTWIARKAGADKDFRFIGLSLVFICVIRRSIKNTEKANRTIRHERIHLAQYLELLIIGFLVLYFVNFLYNLIKYKDFVKAYRNIILEREAKTCDNIVDYINYRKNYAFLNF